MTTGPSPDERLEALEARVAELEPLVPFLPLLPILARFMDSPAYRRVSARLGK